MREPVKNALKDARMTNDDLDEVVLVGGSTRVPAVQQLVKELTGKQPNMGVNPDEVVAVGAAIQAAVLTGEVKDVVLLDVTPLSLGVETMGGVMTTIIERNTTIPARRSEIFSTAEDNQPAVDIHVLQGERKMAQDNRTLGQFKLDGIPQAPRGLPQIEVTFDIDANGILKVSAQDKSSGKEQTVTISNSSNLDQVEIDRMVAEAKKHSEEDQQRSYEAERRNYADGITYSIRRQLEEVGENMDPAERTRIQGLIDQLQEALQEKAPIDSIEQLVTQLESAAAILAEAGTQRAAEQPSSSDDEVIDAEYDEKIS